MDSVLEPIIPGMIQLPLMRTLAVLAGFLAAWAGCSAARALDLTEQDRRALFFANSLIEQGRKSEGYSTLDSLLAATLQRVDPALRMAVLTTKGGHLSWAGDAREAEPLLKEAIQLAKRIANPRSTAGPRCGWATAFSPRVDALRPKCSFKRLSR
jgi:hypothetical protein